MLPLIKVQADPAHSCWRVYRLARAQQKNGEQKAA